MELDCEFINKCPDNKRYRKANVADVDYEDLANQHEELCTCTGLGCLIRNNFLQEVK